MNDEIKVYARCKKVPLWEIASRLGVSESTMTRMMRKELPAEKAEEIKKIILQVVRERAQISEICERINENGR